ncbi:glycosyl hydrolase family 17 protein [Rhodohalobacter mucosus]|uniref:Endo-1,3-beta-glucanase btgC n=1 Tax=Rhodohalobacter mucosus TaxID=2079485 RepID=A0A316TV34_9BACT|nr:glycosyl hydrolase family 17 protein [Rhodohalobacter mucosus]PWN06224.1 glycosyl hydrolase [Rhodohalobacter mucosus]
MSFRKEKFLSYRESDVISRVNYLDDLSDDEIKNLFLEVLYNGVHGFCFSLYEEGQKPGDIISGDQIRKRIEILNKYTGWIRSFSCTEGNELIPKIAKEYGMKTLVGAWLGNDEEKNSEEIENLIKLAEEGYVDIAAVGNEVLYRGDLTESKLLEYMNQVKSGLPDIPVGYVDAYYEFVQRPEISETCDVILCNCYPYWEGTHFKHSFQHMRQMYHQVVDAAPGKRVIITETGWPSRGEGLGNAEPSERNAMMYFINTELWSNDEDIEVFYFSSFDEDWKVSAEGDVGAYWGIWDKVGNLKYG